MWICKLILVFVWFTLMQVQIHACEHWGNVKHKLIFNLIFCTPSVNDNAAIAVGARLYRVLFAQHSTSFAALVNIACVVVL